MGFLDRVKDAAGKAAEQAKHAAAAGKDKIEEVRAKQKADDAGADSIDASAPDPAASATPPPPPAPPPPPPPPS